MPSQRPIPAATFRRCPAVVLATMPTAPDTPTNLAAAAVSNTELKLTWSAAVSGGLPIRNYSVFRGTAPAAMIQVGTTAKTSYPDPSLTPGTTYYYAVEAADTGGDLSGMTAPLQATAPALPSAPANLTATAINPTQVTLNWTAAQSGMPINSYSVYRGNSPDSLTPLNSVGGKKTTANDYPVTAGTTYYYAVSATDTSGNISPLSATVAVTTPN